MFYARFKYKHTFVLIIVLVGMLIVVNFVSANEFKNTNGTLQRRQETGQPTEPSSNPPPEPSSEPSSKPSSEPSPEPSSPEPSLEPSPSSEPSPPETVITEVPTDIIKTGEPEPSELATLPIIETETINPTETCSSSNDDKCKVPPGM